MPGLLKVGLPLVVKVPGTSEVPGTWIKLSAGFAHWVYNVASGAP